MTLEVGITCFDGRMMVKETIRDNRAIWLCKVHVRGKIGMGGYAEHILRPEREQGIQYKPIG